MDSPSRINAPLAHVVLSVRQILQVVNARAALDELAGVMWGHPDIELTAMTEPGSELVENVHSGGPSSDFTLPK
jgi:hypothetical protein